jgi:quaternary ammonium compound-resistance protein SugE
VLTGISLVASMGLLGWAVKSLPLGTAYAVWTGVGAVGTAIVGILLFKEPATAGRLVCLALIVSGILGLKLFTPAA